MPDTIRKHLSQNEEEAKIKHNTTHVHMNHTIYETHVQKVANLKNQRT